MYISIFIHWYVFDISMFFYPFVHFFVCFLGVNLFLSFCKTFHECEFIL